MTAANLKEPAEKKKKSISEILFDVTFLSKGFGWKGRDGERIRIDKNWLLISGQLRVRLLEIKKKGRKVKKERREKER